MKIALIIFLVLFAMVATVLVAHAQPCAQDAAKFCAKVKPGEGRLARCLDEHMAELSPACKKNRIEMKEAIKEVQKACKDEIPKYCKGPQAEESQVNACLWTNKEHLSPACRLKVSEAERKSK